MYLTSSMLPSLTSSDGRTSCVPLADVIPWIYIARTMSIDRDHRNDVERQRSEIVTYWDRNTEESERTWGRVADAIGRLGGHRNLEAEIRQLGTTPTGPAGTNLRIPTTPGAASSPTEFSDALSPTELVSWLSQQFQAKGLTLDSSLRQKLTGNTDRCSYMCECVHVTECVCVCACGSS